MRLLAYAKLLNKKINSADNKAQNPFIDYNNSLNHFGHPLYSTLVWVEPDDDSFTNFKKK